MNLFIKSHTRFAVLLLAVLFTLNTKAQTYYITNTSMGLTGSADVVMAQAVTAANAGGNVIVNMNAPGLCNIGSSSILMNLFSGTITIQRDPLATVDQGFNGTNLTSWMDSTVCLNVLNLKFQNTASCIILRGGDKFVVDGCSFSYSTSAIWFVNQYTFAPKTMSPTKNVLIQNSEFGEFGAQTNKWGVLYDNNTNRSLAAPYRLLNNNFKGAKFSVEIKTSASYDNIKAEIKNNYSSINAGSYKFGAGYVYQNPIPSNNNDLNDYLYTLDFQNNTTVNSLYLNSPLNSWRIENNTFTGGQNNINISQHYGSSNQPPVTPRNYKLGLINTNTPYCNNQTYLNGNNVFLKPSSYPVSIGNIAFSVKGNYGLGCSTAEFSDLDIPGAAIIMGNVSIRRCRIWSSYISDLPLMVNAGGIYGTLFPTMVSGNQLTAYYTYSGVSNIDNNDLYVDFYKSNANGDLLDYIGYQYIPAGTLTGYNNVTLPIPVGVSLSQSDRVAMTITGLQPIGSTNVVAKGTSLAFYPIAPCTSPNFAVPAPGCIGPVSFVANSSCVHPQTAMWNFGDGSFGNGGYATHTYNAPGTYNVTLMVNAPWQNTTYTSSNPVTINNCQPPQACANCIGSFAPDAGEYILSAWVKEDVNPSPISYNNAKVQISFTGHPNVYTFGTNIAKNKIIDGWQRIEESFTIPVNATHVNLNLVNTALSGGADVYFDDIRIFPKDGQMKTYVYDPITLKLSAVLDENNYASFYEYDEEGKLLRVKKETEKGIMTLQENRESLKKK